MDILLRNRLKILVKVQKMGSTDKKHVKTRSEVKKNVLIVENATINAFIAERAVKYAFTAEKSVFELNLNIDCALCLTL
jgi:hypothetical protein